MVYLLLGLVAGASLSRAIVVSPALAFGATLVLLAAILSGPGRPHPERVLLFGWFLFGMVWSGGREAERKARLGEARAVVRILCADGDEVCLVGRVLTPPSSLADYASFEIAVGRLTAGGRRVPIEGARIRCRGGGPWSLQRGAGIRLEGNLEIPGPASNPHGFALDRYLEGKDVAVSVRTGRDAVRVTEPPGWVSASRSRLDRAGFAFQKRIRDALPARSARLLEAFLWGDRTELPGDLRETFSRLGLAHLLALSGLHLAILMGVGLLVIGPSSASRRREDGLLVLAGLYTLMTGLRPSLVRTMIMLLHHVFARRLGRGRYMLESFHAAGCLALTARPAVLHDLGFRFSMGATLGILVFAPPLERLFRRSLPHGRPARWLSGSLAVTLAAQVFTLPLQVHVFSQWTPAAWAVNLVSVPLFAVPVVLGFVGDIVSVAAPALGGPLLWSAGWALRLWLGMIELVAPLAPPLWGTGDLVLWASLPAAWMAILVRPRRPVGPSAARLIRRRAGTLALVAAYLALLASPQVLRARPPAYPRILLFDVGQGDAILITWPDGTSTLVDGGSGFGMSGSDWRVLLPYFKGEGIRALRQVVLTHCHRDHYGGLVRLPFLLEVGEVVVGSAARGTWFDRYRRFLEDRRQPWRWAARGDTLVVGGAGGAWGMRVLGPGPGVPPRTGGANARSLVSQVWWEGGRLLLMGDLDAPGEARLLEGSVELGSTILKVGHHGSRTSSGSAFLRCVGPRLALVSCGRSNRYGHPHPETIGRLRSLGIPILRTDHHGALLLCPTPEGIGVTIWRAHRRVTLPLRAEGSPAGRPGALAGRVVDTSRTDR